MIFYNKLFKYEKILLFISCVTFATMMSCAEDISNSQLPDEKEKDTSKSLAIETIAEYQVETYSELIDNIKHKDFINTDVAMAISKSSYYKAKRNTRSTNDSDTLYFTEQIPVCEYIYQETRIYIDGKAESLYKNDIDPEGNPILNFYDTPIDLEQFIAKIEIEDGYRKCYNKAGKLLSSEPDISPNMKEYLEQIKIYAEQAEEQESKTRNGFKRDIEWLRDQMKSQSQTRSGQVNYYKIEQLPNGNVMLEQELYSGDMQSNFSITKGGDIGRLITRTILSPDITKPMGYELLEDGMLIERRTYSYTESNIKTRNLNSPMLNDKDINPSQIMNEKLVILNDGTPLIEVKNENYKQNQTIFHFLEK